MMRNAHTDRARRKPAEGFARTDLVAVVALVLSLAVVAWGWLAQAKSRARAELCRSNLGSVGRAVLLYAGDHTDTLPGPSAALQGELWWWYKEQVKGYAGLTGAPSLQDRVFACPLDRGYSEPAPFHKTRRFAFSSYVFNGVTLLGMPQIAGWKVSSVRRTDRTLLVMEWSAHAPLSWHRSKTGRANAPFYSNAESMVAFVDGHTALTPIYYDGYSPAYTRDPIPGYAYQYSGH